MSQEYAWPATWRRRPEAPARDERPAHAAGEGDGGVQGLSKVPQAFDLFVFGALALTVFPQVFFPAFGPGAGVAAAIAVWALAYLVAWPVRAALVRLDGRWDPRIRLALARVLFTGSTLAVAALPDASHAAWAPLLLILARIGQGLALGGLVHGRRVGNVTPVGPWRHGLGGWIFAGSVGFTAGAVILGILAVMLQRADVLAWGWRYPFVMALAFNMVAGFADVRLEWARDNRSAARRTPLRLVTVSGARLD